MEDRMDISNEEKLEWLMNEYGGNVARLAFTYMKIGTSAISLFFYE